MPPLETSTGLLIADFPVTLIELIDRLDDPELEWLPLEAEGEPQRLFCDELQLRCNGVSEATLSMRIGEGVFQLGDTGFRDHQPVDLTGKFVRLSINILDALKSHVWIGYIKGMAQDRSAVKPGGTPSTPDPDENKLTGRQQLFECVGLEYFLGRVQIDSAVVREGLGADVRIQRAMTFNGDRSVSYDNDTSKRGNRFTLPQFDTEGNPETDADNEDFAFSNGAQPGVLWSAKDIVRHVLRYHTPRNKANEPAPCPYRLMYDDGEILSTDDQSILAGIYPTIHSERKTVLEILNEAIDRRRGVCWWLETPETAAGLVVAMIRVASGATSAIDLPGGGTMPVNADRQTFNLDGQLDADDFTLLKDRARCYDQIVARGARMTTTMTVSTADGTLEPDWSAALETAYKAGGGGATAYLKDNYRRDEKFGPVYSWFRIPHDWDGTVGNGFGSGTPSPAMPTLSPSGTPVGDPVPLSMHGLRLLTSTRLLVGYNYASSAGSPSAIHEIPTGSTPDMMRPFAFFIYPPAGGGAVIGRLADKLQGQPGPVGDLTESYHVTIQQNTPGIILRATGGRQHKLAGDSWTGTGTATTAYTPELDYTSGGSYDVILAATVTAEVDKYAEAVYPANLDHVPEGKPVEKLTLYLGDKYRLDYLANETVLFIDHESDGTDDVVFATGGVIRNDQPQLQDIARMAYEWYKLGRQPIAVTFKHCNNVFRLGMLITTIGEGSTLVNVNTVVTSIRFDLLRGRMTVSTDEAELSFA